MVLLGRYLLVRSMLVMYTNYRKIKLNSFQVVKSNPKTLEQREQEYAEARERILGKEPFPDTKPNVQQKQQNGGGGRHKGGGATSHDGGGKKSTKNSYETAPPHKGNDGDKHHFNPLFNPRR